HELSKRTARIANRWVHRLDEISAEEILWRVEQKVFDLVLAETPSRESDFLEIAFVQAVQRRTANAVDRHNNSPIGRRRRAILSDPADNDNDTDEIERPIELAVDGRPGPEAILLQLEYESLRPEWLQKALAAGAAVKDPRHLEAVK